MTATVLCPESSVFAPYPLAYGQWFATICLATFWPHRMTIGMPPPGFTDPPTKKRFEYLVLCFGALKARFFQRSLTTP